MNDLPDGFRNELARSLEAFRLDTRCKGDECPGWHLSNLDTYVPCRGCNATGHAKEHPEESYDTD